LNPTKCYILVESCQNLFNVSTEHMTFMQKLLIIFLSICGVSCNVKNTTSLDESLDISVKKDSICFNINNKERVCALIGSFDISSFERDESILNLNHSCYTDTCSLTHITFNNKYIDKSNPMGYLGYNNPTDNHLRVMNGSENGSIIFGVENADCAAVSADCWLQTATGIRFSETRFSIQMEL